MKKVLFILLSLSLSYSYADSDTCYVNARNYVNTYITQNSVRAITGNILNTALNKIINSIYCLDTSGGGVSQSALNDSITAVRVIRKVDTLYRNLDSLVFKINGVRYSIKDSISNLTGYALQVSLNDSVTTLRNIRKVDTLYKNTGGDSIVFTINGLRASILDNGSNTYAGNGLTKYVDTIKLGGRTTQSQTIVSVGSPINNPIGGVATIWTDTPTRPTVSIECISDDFSFLTGYECVNFNTLDIETAQIGSFDYNSSSDLDDNKLMFLNNNGSKETYLIGLPTDDNADQIVVRDSATNRLYIANSQRLVEKYGVTSIATDNTLTGGTITSSGTLKVDTTVISTKNYALNIGKQNLGLSYADSISLSISGGNTIKFAYAVDSVSKIGDSLIVIKAGLRRSYSLGSSGGGSISGLTAATATNSINNLNYKQRWFANTIGADTAFVLGTSSTAAASNLQTVLSVNQSGANATSTQSTYGIKISNKKTGTASTNIGIDLDVSGGGTNNAINVTSGSVLLNNNSLVFGPASNMLQFNGQLNTNANTIQNSPNAGTGQIHAMTCGGYYQFSFGMNASYNAPYFSMGGTVWNNGTTYYSYGTNSILFRDLAGDLAISQDASLSYGGTFTPTERIRFKANGTVGIGTSSPSANTKLEITTTTTMPIKLTPMTATQASALTAEDGGLIYVSDTNGTFTSIGFWGRENGVWVKL